MKPGAIEKWLATTNPEGPPNVYWIGNLQIDRTKSATLDETAKTALAMAERGEVFLFQKKIADGLYQ